MTRLKVRIHGATLRAILHATSVTRRGYTVATFRATLRAILDQRLPSSHAMMFTSRNPKWRRLARRFLHLMRAFSSPSKSTNARTLGVLALVLLDGEEKARIK